MTRDEPSILADWRCLFAEGRKLRSRRMQSLKLGPLKCLATQMDSDSMNQKRAPTVALVAGELSGDLLGGSIARAIKKRFPEARIVGVAGEQMRQAGCEAIGSIDELSVMGIAEVLPAIPRILRFRKRLLEQFSTLKPDIVVGIDAPDFNLGLERRLRKQGIRTAHVVSPTIWAWRPGRVHGIVRSTELMLCLLPFEPEHYQGHPITARYIGHPLADELEQEGETRTAREALGMNSNGPVVAILPGSRGSELKYLAEPFARAAAHLTGQLPGIRFVTPLAKPKLRATMEAAIKQYAPESQWTLVQGQSREAMRAADAVLLASGTATLECLLLGRPMTVAYRASAFSIWVMRQFKLLKTAHVSLPNLLMSEPCVTELLQEDASPENLAADVLRLLSDPAARHAQLAQFRSVHDRLRCEAASQAAQAISEFAGWAPDPA